ncbi:hypothetical protein QQZ08_001142 [Neonectria magnoliae]|uniref:Amidase domain-containing protein n=1 Tax=Neonectria magnoliae TaxID=2732573 RepID=A0ABR1IHC9_9HYPO
MVNPSQYIEAENQVRYTDMFDAARAARALEDMRKRLYEDWMDRDGLDLVAFPTNGDVAYADTDETYWSMCHALQEGIKYSNGGRALKHLGVPCITVPMGLIEDKKMPVGINLCAKGFEDEHLLQCAFAYEDGSRTRTAPPAAPPLPTDHISLASYSPAPSRKSAPVLSVETSSACKEDASDEEVRIVSVACTVCVDNPAIKLETVTAYVNGDPFGISVEGGRWMFQGCLTRSKRMEKFPTLTTVPKDQFMVVVVAKASNDRSAGAMLMIA